MITYISSLEWGNAACFKIIEYFEYPHFRKNFLSSQIIIVKIICPNHPQNVVQNIISRIRKRFSIPRIIFSPPPNAKLQCQKIFFQIPLPDFWILTTRCDVREFDDFQKQYFLHSRRKHSTNNRTRTNGRRRNNGVQMHEMIANNNKGENN